MDLRLKRRIQIKPQHAFRTEMLTSFQTSKYYKKGRLNESLTLVFLFGGIASILHTDIDNIYSREERTKRRLLNTTGMLLMGASALTLKYYLKNMGQAVRIRNEEILLNY